MSFSYFLVSMLIYNYLFIQVHLKIVPLQKPWGPNPGSFTKRRGFVPTPKPLRLSWHNSVAVTSPKNVELSKSGPLRSAPQQAPKTHQCPVPGHSVSSSDYKSYQ